MKWVIDINEMKVIQVPKDYMECSICHRWKPKESYSDGGPDPRRSNCDECFAITPHEKFIEKADEGRDKVAALHKDPRLRMLMRGLRREMEIRNKGITKSALKQLFDNIISELPEDAIISVEGEIDIEKTFLNKDLYILRTTQAFED